MLKAGSTIPAGTYRFVAHYGPGAPSHNPDDDTYEAFGTDINRTRLHVYGNFS